MSIEKPKETALSRRAMLTRLGLAATAIYAAPSLLKLGEAQVSAGGSGAQPDSGQRQPQAQPQAPLPGRPRQTSTSPDAAESAADTRIA